VASLYSAHKNAGRLRTLLLRGCAWRRNEKAAGAKKISNVFSGVAAQYRIIYQP